MADRRREALLLVADRLCAELGYPCADEECSAGRRGLHRDRMAGVLSSEDEALVVVLREGLARIASVAGDVAGAGGTANTVSAALKWAETVMRGELASGNAEELPSLMPSFVFLVTLPVVKQDEALDLSRRTSELIEEALEG